MIALLRRRQADTAAAPDDEGVDTDTEADSVYSEALSAPERAEIPREATRWWVKAIAFGLLPVIAVFLGAAAGYLKWRDTSTRDSQRAAITSVQAATEGTIAMLSYRADSVETDLEAASARLTGSFHDAYTSLIRDVVIPGAKQQRISAVASVPAAASVSASGSHAVVVVFVNQTTTVGDSAPTNTTSSVQVTLDRVGDRWLISEFTPV